MLEKGSSHNSRMAYRADARRLAEYLEECGMSVATADVDTLQGFIASLHDLGLSPRSTARILFGHTFALQVSDSGGICGLQSRAAAGAAASGAAFARGTVGGGDRRDDSSALTPVRLRLCATGL